MSSVVYTEGAGEGPICGFSPDQRAQKNLIISRLRSKWYPPFPTQCTTFNQSTMDFPMSPGQKQCSVQVNLIWYLVSSHQRDHTFISTVRGNTALPHSLPFWETPFGRVSQSLERKSTNRWRDGGGREGEIREITFLYFCSTRYRVSFCCCCLSIRGKGWKKELIRERKRER